MSVIEHHYCYQCIYYFVGQNEDHCFSTDLFPIYDSRGKLVHYDYNEVSKLNDKTIIKCKLNGYRRKESQDYT